MFRPERWLKGSEEVRKKWDLNLNMVFECGKYLYLGKNVAMMELNKVFVQIRHLSTSFR